MAPEELERLKELTARLREEDFDTSRLTSEERQELSLLLLKFMREEGLMG